MATNHGVVFLGPSKVAVQSIDYPRFQNPAGKPIEHGVIFKTVSTNICGSDQHMLRGRTTAPPGMVLGHEITGEIVEKGKDVEFLNLGDLVSVPFNTVISLDDAPRGYQEFDAGVARKFGIDPHGIVRKA